MANRNERTPGNVSGAFYVDVSCVDCDICRNTAPATFARNDEVGASFVVRQPETPEEIELAKMAVEGCPTDSIGFDG